MQLPIPKSKTVTGALYKHVVLKKVKAHFKRRRPKAGLKYLRLLHDNAPAHKASIVTEFRESENVNVLPHHSFHLTWLPVIISCFLNSNSICVEKDMSRNALGTAVYQFLMGVPIQDY